MDINGREKRGWKNEHKWKSMCLSISFEHKYPYQKPKDPVFTIFAQKQLIN
jgi:hypothetical protein